MSVNKCSEDFFTKYKVEKDNPIYGKEFSEANILYDNGKFYYASNEKVGALVSYSCATVLLNSIVQRLQPSKESDLSRAQSLEAELSLTQAELSRSQSQTDALRLQSQLSRSQSQDQLPRSPSREAQLSRSPSREAQLSRSQSREASLPTSFNIVETSRDSNCFFDAVFKSQGLKQLFTEAQDVRDYISRAVLSDDRFSRKIVLDLYAKTRLQITSPIAVDNQTGFNVLTTYFDSNSTIYEDDEIIRTFSKNIALPRTFANDAILHLYMQLIGTIIFVVLDKQTGLEINNITIQTIPTVFSPTHRPTSDTVYIFLVRSNPDGNINNLYELLYFITATVGPRKDFRCEPLRPVTVFLTYIDLPPLLFSVNILLLINSSTGVNVIFIELYMAYDTDDED